MSGCGQEKTNDEQILSIRKRNGGKMNKKIRVTVSIIIVVFVVCGIFGITAAVDRNKNKEKDVFSEIFAQISIPEETDGFTVFQDVHISDNEEEVFLSGQHNRVVDMQSSESNNAANEVQIEAEGAVLYRAAKENGQFTNITKIEMEEYHVLSFLWDGDELYFIGKDKNDLSNEDTFYYLGNLYHAEIEENRITNVQEIKAEDTIQIIGEAAAAIRDGRLLFYGRNHDAVAYYTGTLNGGTLDNITKVWKTLENEYVQSVKFGDGNQQLIVSMLDLGGESGFLNSYETAELSNQGVVNRKKVEFGSGVSAEGSFVCFDINTKKHTFYYTQYTDIDDSSDTAGDDGSIAVRKNFTIYKIRYDKTVQSLFNDIDSTVLQETNEYHSGDYSYDAYDTGDFELVKRNKSDMSEKQGVWYEIFVRAFADSDGDGIGDFNGIRQKLDYLANLGVEGIWLMPINESPSYHGYDITDYKKLNSDYGTEEDFANLIQEAHAKGIKVIMDFPINHTSSEHPWFVSALSDENSEYRNFYRWVHRDDTVDYSGNDESDWGSSVWHQVGNAYYYGMFSADMPDLNYNNPAVREEIKSAAGKWLEMGVDGFRLDAAMHIYGRNEFKQEENPTESTLQWWNEFAVYCEQINPNVYLVGEAWKDDEVLEEYVQPFDTKFNFAFEQKLMEAVVNGTAVTNTAENLSQILQAILDKYAGIDGNYLDGVFGTNHDQNRIMSQVSTESKARLVADIYLTLPGNPFIYYGEELGMSGSKPDEMIRTPFKWSETGQDAACNTTWIEDSQNADTKALDEQMADESSMYHFYQTLIAVRKSNSALTEGTYTAVDLNNDALMAYERESSEQKLLMIHNLSGDTQTVDISGYQVKQVVYDSCRGSDGASAEDKTGAEVEGSSVTLQAEASVILEVE